jgi:hypothetical protein
VSRGVADGRTCVYVDGTTRLTLRVVRIPSYSEQLDDLYRERRATRGSDVDHEGTFSIRPRVSVRGRLGRS